MSSELKCSICLDFYNSSENKPCILSCGHSFCRSCLIQLESRFCSTCRSEFEPEEYTINYALMSLAENKTEDDDEDICREHNLPKNCECSTHRTMICAACGMVNHKQCETSFIGEKLSSKKRKFNEKELDKDNEKVHLKSVCRVAKLMVKEIELEKTIKESTEESIQLKETKKELEKENQRRETIELRKTMITVQKKKVQNSPLVSEFVVNEKILVDLQEEFQRDFGESPAPKRRRMKE